MNKTDLIYVSGHDGMVGSHLIEQLESLGYTNIITKPFSELDLRNQAEVNKFIRSHKPDYVFHLAAKVGGILANMEYPAEFMYDNLMMAGNIIEASRLNGVKKLLFMGSSCIYPKLTEQPMKESSLLTGSLEPTNEGYSLSKIAGLKLIEYYNKQYGLNYISVMPPNLYGLNDSFDPKHSHVISALIRKFHEAKQNDSAKVVLWGSGMARREFMFTNDVVDGLIFLMQNFHGNSHINLGTSTDISILELADLIRNIVGFNGSIEWDQSKPDGMPKKLMDSSKVLELGWKPKTSLETGITKTYNWYKETCL
jgi:GDP-L-fucose synthase